MSYAMLESDILIKESEAKSQNANFPFIQNSSFLGTFWDGSVIALFSIVKKLLIIESWYLDKQNDQPSA